MQKRCCAHLLHDGLIHIAVALVVHALLQRHIDTVVLAAAVADVVQRARAWEEVAIPAVMEVTFGDNTLLPPSWYDLLC